MKRASSDLIERVLAGDPASFQTILDWYSDDVLRLAYALLRDEEEAKDVLQEAMFSLVKVLERQRFRESDGSIKGFLLTSTRNLCLNRLRRRPEFRSVDESNSPVPVRLQEQHTPDVAADENRLRSAFDNALAQLTELQRAALVLRELNGESHQEIAEALGTSPECIKALLYRARKKMRVLLKPYVREP